MKVIAATKNNGKVLEFSAILKELGVEVISQNQAGIYMDVEENATTFKGNALLKAKAISAVSSMAALADDSGLCVEALNGAPGVFSARYAGNGATDEMLIEKLLYELKDIPKMQRSAKFVSVVALVLPDGRSFTADGEVLGHIGFSPCGTGGFGYDPIFISKEAGLTFAEMPAEVKNKISHRYRAITALAKILKDKNIAF